MNIKKSIEIAMINGGYTSSYVADKMNITRPSFSQLKNRDNCTTKTITALADVFNMPVSEFIKLGESA